MSNSLNKSNAPYLIASFLATLTLLTSVALAVTANVPLPLILALAILSVLVLALSCKIISNNKEREFGENKFAKQNTELGNTRQQLEAILKELNNKIIEVVDAASKQAEKLNDQLHKLTRKKLDADKEVEKWKSILCTEGESFEQKLEGKTNRIAELCRMVDELEKIINTPYKQEKKLHYKRQIKELRYKQIKKLHYKRIKGLLHCKISRLHEQYVELEDEQSVHERKKSHNEGEVVKKNKECHDQKCREEREELCADLGGLQCKIEKITKENKNLSEELKKKSEELHDADNLISDQFSELYKIYTDYSDKVKKLKKIFLKEILQEEELIEKLLENKEEEIFFMQQTIEYVVGKVEQSVKGSKEIIDDDKKIILQTIQEIRSVLEKEIIQSSLDKAYASSYVENLEEETAQEVLHISPRSNTLILPCAVRYECS